MTTMDAAIAANRFGLGAGPGELRAIAGDPRGWLSGQLTGAPPRPADVPSSAERAAAFLRAQRRGPGAVEAMMRDTMRDTYMGDAGGRTAMAVGSDRPFVERMVHFWSNHFTVSAVRPHVAALAWPFESEAVRPHVTGRFADMLKAVMRHPAMLLYLDNAQSFGPNSPVGRRRGRGLNENLAREILELHTLGVDAGYTQDDVRALAAILTGWTIDRDRRPGAFMFAGAVHEPGDKLLMGRRYHEAGEAEGIAALDWLARHPATARHVATKLVRHFVDDDPPAAAVEHMANVFLSSDGDLGAVTAALVDLPQAWQAPLAKLRTPNELVIASLRALDVEVAAEGMVGPLHVLGQPPFRAPSPAGWPDTAAEWLGPEALMSRADWAMAVGQRTGRLVDPRSLAERSFGPLATDTTRSLIAGAPSAAEGVALVLLSPEFQRR